MERELTLKDMLIILLKNAKLIVVLALVIALLFGAFGAYRSYGAQSGSGEAAYLRYLQELEKAQQEYDRAERSKSELEAYLADSLYYAIDPYNKGISSILFYVDTNPTVKAQGLDRAVYAVAAYTEMYKNDDDIMTALREIIGKDVDKKYILELIKVETVGNAEATAAAGSANNNLVRITVVHEDAEIASKMAHCIYEISKDKINETVAAHTTGVLTDYSGYEIDSTLIIAQEMRANGHATATTALQEKQKALDDLVNNSVTDASEASIAVVTKQSMKFAAMGAAVGLVICCVLSLFITMMSGKLQNVSDAATRYKFPVLGVLPQDNKWSWFNGWIKALEGESKSTFEAEAKVVAANLGLVAGSRKVMLVSTGDKADSERFVSYITEAIGESDKLRAVAICTGGNILEDATTVQALADVDAVVLMECRGSAKLQVVDSEVLRLEALGKEILGIVLC